jgi:hypothetical protein
MMSTRESPAPSSKSKTYRLKVTLRGSRPPIWRRLEVDGGLTLAQLHHVLQLVMGWTDSHLHQFRHGTTYYGQPDPEMGMERENERRVVLQQVLRRPKERMVYEYDFGDGWEHDILLEAIAETGTSKVTTRVLAGKRACPPEDVGGIGGYYRFLEAIQDPKHPEHGELLEWGGPFDPDAFELDEINRYFEKRSPKRRDA